MDDLKKTAHVALLAPVPLKHLESGQEVKGRVAFGGGSQTLKLLHKLDEEREDMEVDVYIYASDPDVQSDFEVSWSARYVGCVPAVNGEHPDGMKYRPKTTASDGYSEVFWEVKDLERLPPKQHILVAKLTGLTATKTYSPAYAPRRPVLIKHPPASSA